MKRSALTRRSPLARTRFRRNRRPNVVTPEERQARLNFRLAIVGMRCVMCGRTHVEAFEATGGYGLHSHHGIRRQVLRRLGLDEWATENALPVCEEPCHRRHHSRKQPIPRAALPTYFLDWCWRMGLTEELSREYTA